MFKQIIFIQIIQLFIAIITAIYSMHVWEKVPNGYSLKRYQKSSSKKSKNGYVQVPLTLLEPLAVGVTLHFVLSFIYCVI